MRSLHERISNHKVEEMPRLRGFFLPGLRQVRMLAECTDKCQTVHDR